MIHIKKKYESFEKKVMNIIISNDIVNINQLKKICWNGIPSELGYIHSEVWKYLLKYYPEKKSKKQEIINKQRQAYIDILMIYNSIPKDSKEFINQFDIKVYNQINQDVPRTMQRYSLFKIPYIKDMITRILYIFSMKHQSSKYVQGFVDLCLPFLLVFLNSYLQNQSIQSILNLNEESLFNLGEGCLMELESDIYWCFDCLMQQIETNFCGEREEIKILINKLENIIKIVDYSLYNFLINNKIIFSQFAFRWISCLLIRELNIISVIRLFDSYFSWSDDDTKNGFTFFHFHTYVCASLLLLFKDDILKFNDYHKIVNFLQNLPVKDWNQDNINFIIAKAYQLCLTYKHVIN